MRRHVCISTSSASGERVSFCHFHFVPTNRHLDIQDSSDVGDSEDDGNNNNSINHNHVDNNESIKIEREHMYRLTCFVSPHRTLAASVTAYLHDKCRRQSNERHCCISCLQLKPRGAHTFFSSHARF